MQCNTPRLRCWAPKTGVGFGQPALRRGNAAVVRSLSDFRHSRSQLCCIATKRNALLVHRRPVSGVVPTPTRRPGGLVLGHSGPSDYRADRARGLLSRSVLSECVTGRTHPRMYAVTDSDAGMLSRRSPRTRIVAICYLPHIQLCLFPSSFFSKGGMTYVFERL